VNRQPDHFAQNTLFCYELNLFYNKKVGLNAGQFGHVFALPKNDSSKDKIVFDSLVHFKVLFA
jgi:hypothetical protein